VKYDDMANFSHYNTRGVTLRRNIRGGSRIEGARLIKSNILRDPHTTSNWIPTTIAYEHTINRLRGQFSASTGSKKNIAQTSKKAKTGVIRWMFKKALIGDATFKSG
jgi:hypothetical protein